MYNTGTFTGGAMQVAFAKAGVKVKRSVGKRWPRRKGAPVRVDCGRWNPVWGVKTERA